VRDGVVVIGNRFRIAVMVGARSPRPYGARYGDRALGR
jgi:hypothetical protein